MTPAVFHLISRHREVAWVEKRGAARISDETLGGVLEIASQMNLEKFKDKVMVISIRYPNHCQGIM